MTLGNQLYRGAPARYAHHGIVEKVPKDFKRVSCSKCNYYVETDKSCSKRKLFMPIAGYNQWKYCNYLSLTDDLNTEEVRSYVKKVKAAINKQSKRHNVTIKTEGILKLKNLVSGEVKIYRISTKEKGEDILHPSDALVIKARQVKAGKSFHWNGKTYKVIE